MTETTRSELETLFAIARGGMGTVELAVRRAERFERLYAVKRLHEHHRDDDSFQRMFLEEGRVAGLIRHPNVVGVLDAGVDEGGPFLVMEYVEGVPLTSVLRASDGELLPLELCAEIARQAALGLHAAHQLRTYEGDSLDLVHRDVSPHNIMLEPDGRVVLMDFGIAKALGSDARTSTGILKGKLAYMAPEQLAFRPATQASDLFSLGVVLFELLTAERLYGPVKMPETADRILREPPPDLGECRRDAPPELVELCFQLLAKAPEERPPSAEDVAQRLEPLCCGSSELGEHIRATFARSLDEQRQRIASEVRRLRDTEEHVRHDGASFPSVNDSVTQERRRWPLTIGLLTAGLAAAAATAALGYETWGDDPSGAPAGSRAAPSEGLLSSADERSTDEPSDEVQAEDTTKQFATPTPIAAAADAGAQPNMGPQPDAGVADPRPSRRTRRRRNAPDQAAAGAEATKTKVPDWWR